MSKRQKEGTIKLDTTLNADSKENKLIVIAWEKTVLKDQILAAGHIHLDTINNGSNAVELTG